MPPDFQCLLPNQRFQPSFMGLQTVVRLCASGEAGLRGILHAARVWVLVFFLGRSFLPRTLCECLVKFDLVHIALPYVAFLVYLMCFIV